MKSSSSLSIILLLYKKELMNMWRSNKLLWVPLVLLILGISQPISTKFMPEILSAAGNIPEELIQQLAHPLPGEVMVQVISQYHMIGVIVIVLALMGVISGEIQHGIALHFMVKPISAYQYMMSKWLSAMTLILVSFLLGYAGSWYYTSILIGAVDLQGALLGGVYSLIWMLFAGTLIVASSGLVKQPAGGAAITLGLVFAITVMSNIVPAAWKWYPGNLEDAAQHALMGQPFSSGLWALLTVALLCVGVLIILVVRNQRRSSWIPDSTSI